MYAHSLLSGYPRIKKCWFWGYLFDLVHLGYDGNETKFLAGWTSSFFLDLLGEFRYMEIDSKNRTHYPTHPNLLYAFPVAILG